MPYFHCVECYCGWEGSKSCIECNQCGSLGYILEETTPFEALLNQVLNSPEYIQELKVKMNKRNKNYDPT